MAYAHKVYDPKGTGFVDPEMLRTMFQALGFGEVRTKLNSMVLKKVCGSDSSLSLRALPSPLPMQVTDGDLAILVETGDGDGDGRISLADFRGMAGATAPDPPRYADFQGDGPSGDDPPGAGGGAAVTAAEGE